MAGGTRQDSKGEWAWRLGLVFVFALVGTLSLRQLSSGDVGFHLTAGSWILDGNGWPRTDPFTFTVGDHAYVDTSWGYQVLLVLLVRGFGVAGPVLFHAGLILSLWWLVYRSARLAPVDPRGMPLFLVLAAVACEMRYDVRPEVWSYTLLAFVLHLLHRHAAGLRAPLWLLPCVFLVWVNSHSLFVLGWVACACFVVGLWLRDRRPDRRLAGWSLAGIAVALVNPYGWRALWFPFSLLTRFEGSNPFNQTIGEFVSPFDLGISEQFPFYPRLPIFAFRLLFVLVVLSLVPLLRRRRWCAVLLALSFGYLSFRMVRNIPLVLVAGLPGLLEAFSGDETASSRHPRWARAVALAVAAAALVLCLRVVHDGYYIASRRQDRFGIGWNPRTQPVAAAEYAIAAGLDGRVLNHLNFGGYLMWARRRPVFIDGRLEVMGERFFEEYRAVMSDEAAREAAVARYGIEWAIFPYRIGGSLLRALEADPRWTLVYVDSLAALFARTGRLPALATHRLDLDSSEALPGLGGKKRPGAVASWLAGLLRRQRFPSESFNLGLFHYFRGDAPRAAAQFAEAIRSSDGAYYEIYQNLGSALFRSGRLVEARDCYRVVLEEEPGNRLARQRLAEIAARIGDDR